MLAFGGGLCSLSTSIKLSLLLARIALKAPYVLGGDLQSAVGLRRLSVSHSRNVGLLRAVARAHSACTSVLTLLLPSEFVLSGETGHINDRCFDAEGLFSHSFVRSFIHSFAQLLNFSKTADKRS